MKVEEITSKEAANDLLKEADGGKRELQSEKQK